MLLVQRMPEYLLKNEEIINIVPADLRYGGQGS
jgi:hypothetical protein